MIHATASTRKKAPITTVLHGAAGNFAVISSVGNWQMLTSQHLDPDTNAALFSSNVLCMSVKYHYLNTKSEGSFLTVNDMLIGKTTSSEVLDTSPLSYPDPPTEFFRRERLSSDFRQWWDGDAKSETSGEGDQPSSEDPSRSHPGGGPNPEEDVGRRVLREGRSFRPTERVEQHISNTGIPAGLGKAGNPGSWAGTIRRGMRDAFKCLSSTIIPRGATLYSVRLDDELGTKMFNVEPPFLPNVKSLDKLRRFRMRVPPDFPLSGTSYALGLYLSIHTNTAESRAAHHCLNVEWNTVQNQEVTLVTEKNRAYSTHPVDATTISSGKPSNVCQHGHSHECFLMVPHTHY